MNVCVSVCVCDCVCVNMCISSTQPLSISHPPLAAFPVAMASSDLRTSGREAVEEAAPHRRQISEVTSNFLLINTRN